MDKKYKIENIETITNDLNNLPKKSGQASALEIAKQLQYAIENALNLGYSFNEIVKVIKPNCNIGSRNLKLAYEQLTKKTTSKKKPTPIQ